MVQNTRNHRRQPLPPAEEALAMLRECLDEQGIRRLAAAVEAVQEETGWGQVLIVFKAHEAKEFSATTTWVPDRKE